MRTRFAILAAASVLMWWADHGGAYSTTGRRWASGSNVVMHLQFGSSSGSLIDGSSSWNTPAENALAIWNPFLSGMSFSVVRDSTSGNTSGNRINIPGVVDSKSNVIEHPQLIAQRIERYANLVGRDRVIADPDWQSCRRPADRVAEAGGHGGRRTPRHQQVLAERIADRRGPPTSCRSRRRSSALRTSPGLWGGSSLCTSPAA